MIGPVPCRLGAFVQCALAPPSWKYFEFRGIVDGVRWISPYATDAVILLGRLKRELEG